MRIMHLFILWFNPFVYLRFYLCFIILLASLRFVGGHRGVKLLNLVCYLEIFNSSQICKSIERCHLVV